MLVLYGWFGLCGLLLYDVGDVIHYPAARDNVGVWTHDA